MGEKNTWEVVSNHLSFIEEVLKLDGNIPQEVRDMAEENLSLFKCLIKLRLQELNDA